MLLRSGWFGADQKLGGQQWDPPQRIFAETMLAQWDTEGLFCSSFVQQNLIALISALLLLGFPKWLKDGGV